MMLKKTESELSLLGALKYSSALVQTGALLIAACGLIFLS